MLLCAVERLHSAPILALTFVPLRSSCARGFRTSAFPVPAFVRDVRRIGMSDLPRRHSMQKIIEGVQTFRREVFASQKSLFERLAQKQSPQALFITCSDSRINP